MCSAVIEQAQRSGVTSSLTPAPEVAETPLLSVVIPVYRSAKGLPALIERLQKSLDEITERWEVVFVDDASPDESWRVLGDLKGDDPRYVLVQLTSNHGQQRAVLCGLSHTRGEYVVTMDDDLQQRPEEIRLLYDAILERNCDAVVGRYEDKQHGLVRNLGTRLVKRVSRATVGVPIELDLTSFRIMRGDIAHRLSMQRNPNPVVGYLLYRVTSRIENVDVHHDAREIGQSNYGPRKLVSYLMQMILDYSDIPLRMVGYIGFFLALGSFGVGGYYFFRYAQGSISVTGWTTLVLLICLFSGLLLMSVGIIGVYLVRILRSINMSQMWVVRRVQR